MPYLLSLHNPAQAAAILQTTEDQLKSMRESGGGPPFEKLGEGRNAPVRYPLGGFREWRKARTMINTAGARLSRFDGQADFLANGAIDEFHIFAMNRNGIIWDFWAAIRRGEDVAEVMWLRMDDFLTRIRRQANDHFAQREAAELLSSTPSGVAGEDNGRL